MRPERKGLRQEAGATLFVGLMMLVLITLILLAAFTLSTTNLRVVGNMQFREQAIAAANVAIEERIGITQKNITAAALMSPSDHAVDIDRDGSPDYSVKVAMACIQAKLDTAVPPSSLSLPVTIADEGTWDTTWDVTATVTDTRTAASIEMHAGLVINLTNSIKQATCD